MDPKLLFPLLAVLFAVLAAVNAARSRRLAPAGRTWLLLAVCFGAVSAWLHWAQ